MRNKKVKQCRRNILASAAELVRHVGTVLVSFRYCYLRTTIDSLPCIRLRKQPNYLRTDILQKLIKETVQTTLFPSVDTMLYKIMTVPDCTVDVFWPRADSVGRWVGSKANTLAEGNRWRRWIFSDRVVKRPCIPPSGGGLWWIASRYVPTIKMQPLLSSIRSIVSIGVING